MKRICYKITSFAWYLQGRGEMMALLKRHDGAQLWQDSELESVHVETQRLLDDCLLRKVIQ